MDIVVILLLEFIVVTLAVYLIYYIIMIRKYDKEGKLKKKKEKKNILLDRIKKGLFFSEKDEILTRGLKKKKTKKSDNEIDFPTEVELLLLQYDVDLKKINYKKLLKLVGFMCSLDIAVILCIVTLITKLTKIDNVIIELVIGFVLMIPVILIGYKILGTYLDKKGYVKNGNRRNKKNRK